MWGLKQDEVERLLTRESRAGLPLRRLCRLYFDPFALFKDASHGPESARRQALSYNRAMRWMLIPYLRRWLTIAATLFAAASPVQAIASEATFFIVPAAAFAVGSCVACVITASTAVAYLLLGLRR